jgi:O-antigen ligase/Flp pilus assembly protein TadD
MLACNDNLSVRMKDILKAVMFAALFAVPFLTLYVENDYFFPFITGKNFWFRILVDVAFASWALLALYDTKYRPRSSGIIWSFGVLLVVMFFANLLGEHRTSSFWSNFERMDGYVSLVHTFLYALVLGSVLQTKQMWQRLFNTSLFVAFAVALYGLAQFGGLAEGNGRVDSRLGNAAYMAVYMLFHVFIAFWLYVESDKRINKAVYLLLALLFAFVLILTATRGTSIGIVVGIVVMSGYIAIFGTKFKEVRKYALGAFAVMVLAVGALIIEKDSNFVQTNPYLGRIANISINDLTVRGTIWGMAWEGVKERPLLGWGQSNFNYVFNEHYDPALYAQEQWFDRSHNIIFDWLTTGGFLGLISYLSIFVACVWYIFLRPLLRKDDESFTVLERGVLLGILAGYFTHNLVVFDNIVSYMFFAMILGLIHSRVSKPIKQIEKVKVDNDVIEMFAAPIVAALLIAVFYFAYMPGMAAAGDIIKGFQEQDPKARLEYFKQAVNRNSFAQQEVTEQLTQQAISVSRNQSIPAELRSEYISYAEQQLMKLANDKPGDARVHVFIGSFYRSTNQIEKAAEQFAIARELSPRKQSIITQQGFVELTKGDNEKARDFFKEAYELDTRNLEAKEYYIAGLLYTGGGDEAQALIDSDAIRDRVAKSDFVLSSANQNGYKEFMLNMFERRIELDPTNPQSWATLAYLYYQNGEKDKALDTLNRGKEQIPTFAPTASCFSENIKAGKDPQEGC